MTDLILGDIMSQASIGTQYMYAGQTSAYATAATPDTVLSRVQSADPLKESTHIYDMGLGEGLNPTNTYLGPYGLSGNISWFVVDFDFLKYWVGAKSGAGTSGDHYKLTEATAVGLTTSDLQVFTLEEAHTTETTNYVDTFIGCVGRIFTLSGSIGSRLLCEAGWVGRNPTTGTSATSYSANTSPAFVMLGGTWSWGATPSSLAGVRSFRVTMENSLAVDETRSIESRFINQPVLNARTYRFIVEIKMAQALAATIVANHYSKSGEPEDGSTTVTATANLEFKVALANASENATIWLDQCSIDNIRKPVRLGEALVILTFEGSAREGRGNVPIEWWTA